MSKENIGILVGVEEANRRYCNDYNDRKGCGQEVKMRKSATNGKWIACEPVQIPCLDNEGNTIWCWVPHWVACPEQKEYSVEFQRGKASKNEEWKSKNGTRENTVRRVG